MPCAILLRLSSDRFDLAHGSHEWGRRWGRSTRRADGPCRPRLHHGERGRPSSTSFGLRSFYSSDGGLFERGAPVRWSCVRSEGREATPAPWIPALFRARATMQSACSMAARSPSPRPRNVVSRYLGRAVRPRPCQQERQGLHGLVGQEDARLIGGAAQRPRCVRSGKALAY